jgi:mannan endo-1,4-beta-mannosidase
MKRLLILAALALTACGGADKKPMETPKDKLVHQLFSFAEKGQIAYGHQDDLAYGHSWCVEDWENDPLERSDVKAVTGKYPMVMGYELGGIELGDEKSLDGVPFGLIRKAALTHIERGGIVTFSWHPRNPLTGDSAWDVSSDKVVASVLPGGEKYTEFQLWLKRTADFFESLGPDVSVIFRPWHEDSGTWFWWCQNVCTVDEYRELFRMTWLYFVKERGLTNLLWCYSPNGPFTPEGYMARYPGDEFVDIMGADFYEFAAPGALEEGGARFASVIKDMLTKLTALGTEHQKLIALSETGLEGLPDLNWWTKTLYPAIKDYSISYVLTWRNAHDQPGHFYAAWDGFEGAADFKAFSELEQIVFLDE